MLTFLRVPIATTIVDCKLWCSHLSLWFVAQFDWFGQTLEGGNEQETTLSVPGVVVKRLLRQVAAAGAASTLFLLLWDRQ